MAGQEPASTDPERGASDEAWLERLARALGEEPMSRKEIGQLLGLARDVAHGVERKLAPLAAFLVGAHVGRRSAGGAAREDAVSEAAAATARLLPEQHGKGSAPPHRD